MPPKDHSTADCCDARHETLAGLVATVQIQGKLLWLILGLNITALVRLFFFKGV